MFFLKPYSSTFALPKWATGLAVVFITIPGKGRKTNRMSKLHFTTKHANAASVQRNWYVVDGTNQTVGRMCSKVAAILRGKNKAYYTPHVDCGDFIVIINADKVVFTGNKLDQKLYFGIEQLYASGFIFLICIILYFLEHFNFHL